MNTRRPKSRRGARSRRDVLRRALLRRRDELLQGLRHQLTDTQGSRPAKAFCDIADQAAESLHDVLAKEVAEIASADLQMIDLAIEKLNGKTYGVCENCGRRIPPERLRALPFAHLCVQCKRKEEQRAATPQSHLAHAYPPVSRN